MYFTRKPTGTVVRMSVVNCLLLDSVAGRHRPRVSSALRGAIRRPSVWTGLSRWAAQLAAQRGERGGQLTGHVLTSKNITALRRAAALGAARHMEAVTDCLLKTLQD